MMGLKKIIKLLGFFLLLGILLLTNTPSFAYLTSNNSNNISTLSPALNLNAPQFMKNIKNTVIKKETFSFFQKKTVKWQKKTRPLRFHPELALPSVPQIAIDKLNEDLMLYPTDLIRSPELFQHVDINNPAIAHDMDNFKYDEMIGYWRSKKFPKLILGSWQDIIKTMPGKDGHSFSGNKASMKHHVITRCKNPQNGKAISFYYYDDHAYAVPYYLDAVGRKELKSTGNTQIFIDNHRDDTNVFKYVDFPIPQKSWQWLELMNSTGYLSFDNFNSILAKTKFMSTQMHIFDGRASTRFNVRTENMVKRDTKKIADSAVYIGADPEGYFTIEERPRNTSVLINIDTDTTDPMLGLSREPITYKSTQKEALYWYADFLNKLIFDDNLSASAFHANTSADRHQYGDVEIVRFLARIAPALLLNANNIKREALQKYIDEAVTEHVNKVAINQELLKDTKDIIKTNTLETMGNYINQAI